MTKKSDTVSADAVAKAALDMDNILPQIDVKKAAEIGFSAYNKQKGGLTYDNKPIPPWAEIGPEVQAGWVANAEAITAFVIDSIPAAEVQEIPEAVVEEANVKLNGEEQQIVNDAINYARRNPNETNRLSVIAKLAGGWKPIPRAGETS